MNVPELAAALRTERDRHHDELTNIIEEFTGTTETGTVAIADGAHLDGLEHNRRLASIAEHIHGDGSGCFPGCPDYGPDHPNYQPPAPQRSIGVIQPDRKTTP